MNIKTLSFGCRLNALECEKISAMLSGVIDTAILVNTCSVTGEAERQCAQTVRRLSRENPNAVIFVTGCGATRNPKLFSCIPHAFVIDNSDKMKLQSYIEALKKADFNVAESKIDVFKSTEDKFEYYLVSYTMASGDTAQSVSNALGKAYTNDTAEIIKGINGLSDLGRMQAGRTYLFPSTSSAKAAYAVYSHVIVSGDTVGNLCKAYGVDYSKVSTILQGLNPKMNLSAIQAGRKILLVAANSGKGTPLEVRPNSSSSGNGLLPVVTKSPTNETVEKGGSCFFAARYQNAIWAVWHFVSPDGKTDLTYQEASRQFPTMKILNGMYSTMKLENIPLEANGWKVYCRYTNSAGSTDTASALLTVKGGK